MADVIDLSARRAPVWYTLRICHHWDDTIEIVAEDIADDLRSRASINDTLRRLLGTEELRDALHDLVKEAAEFRDCVDNRGGRYQSEYLHKIVEAAKAALAKGLFDAPSPPPGGTT
jgi:hypothetical protein